MADNELDHMMASIHRDASLSNQHAAQTSDFGDVYPAAAGMPNTSWMNQNAFFGSSNTILNTTAPISMTGLDQSGIPKQYHQTHAAYANNNPIDYSGILSYQGDNLQNNHQFQVANNSSNLWGRDAIGGGIVPGYQATGLRTPAASLGVSGDGDQGQFGSGLYPPSVQGPMSGTSQNMDSFQRSFMFLAPPSSNVSSNARKSKQQKRGGPRSGVSANTNPIKMKKKKSGKVHPSVALALLEDSLREHATSSPYFRQILLQSATHLRPVKRLIDEEIFHGVDGQSGNNYLPTTNSLSQDSTSVSEVTDSGYRTEATSVSSTPRQQLYDQLDSLSLNFQPAQPQVANIQNPTVYPCSAMGCSKIFKNFSDWKKHEGKHWPLVRYMCLDCIVTHVDPNGHWTCDFCQVTLSSPGTPGAHYLQCIQAQEQVTTCARKYGLNNHLRKQHGMAPRDANARSAGWHYPVSSEWPRECTPCKMSFTTFEERAKHMAAEHYKRGDYGPRGFYPAPKDDDSDEEDDSDDNNHPSHKRPAAYMGSSYPASQSQSRNQPPGSFNGSWSQFTHSRDATPESSLSHKRFKQETNPEPQIVRRMSVPLERYLHDNEDTTAGLLSAQAFGDVGDPEHSSPEPQSPTCSDASADYPRQPRKCSFTRLEYVEHSSESDASIKACQEPAQSPSDQNAARNVCLRRREIKPSRLLASDRLLGLSSLGLSAVAQEVVHRVKKIQQLDADPLPTSYFNWMGGTSTGGLLAVMLSRCIGTGIYTNDSLPTQSALTMEKLGKQFGHSFKLNQQHLCRIVDSPCKISSDHISQFTEDSEAPNIWKDVARNKDSKPSQLALATQVPPESSLRDTSIVEPLGNVRKGTPDIRKDDALNENPKASQSIFKPRLPPETPIRYTPITGRVSRAKKGVPVHTCEICGPAKTFTRVEHLRRHVLSHQKPKSACTFEDCERAFHRPDLLNRHMNRHETQAEKESDRRRASSAPSERPTFTSSVESPRQGRPNKLEQQNDARSRAPVQESKKFNNESPNELPRKTSEVDIEIYDQRLDKFGRAISEQFASPETRSIGPSVSLIFGNNFWGKSDTVVAPLLSRLENAKMTCDDLKAFYTARSTIEDDYARKLLELARKPLGSQETTPVAKHKAQHVDKLSNFSGSTDIYTHPEAKVDIVLVHGLNGKPRNRWWPTSKEFHWRTDLVPADMKSKRTPAPKIDRTHPYFSQLPPKSPIAPENLRSSYSYPLPIPPDKLRKATTLYKQYHQALAKDNSSMMDEEACRRKLTKFTAFTIRKAAPSSPKEKPTWAKADVVEKQLSQQSIETQVKKLDQTRTKAATVAEKKASLTISQQMKVAGILDDLANKEADPHFEWSLVQLETKSIPSNFDGKHEANSIIAYFLRKPLGHGGQRLSLATETPLLTNVVGRASSEFDRVFLIDDVGSMKLQTNSEETQSLQTENRWDILTKSLQTIANSAAKLDPDGLHMTFLANTQQCEGPRHQNNKCTLDEPGDLSSVVSFDSSSSDSDGRAGFHAYDGRRIKPRRRKALDPKAKAKAALIRYLGACQTCRDRRVPCPLEHHDIATLERPSVAQIFGDHGHIRIPSLLDHRSLSSSSTEGASDASVSKEESTTVNAISPTTRPPKKYGAYYNAAAHLRRAHFNPKANGEHEKRGGGGGGNWPPMSKSEYSMTVAPEFAIEYPLTPPQEREAQVSDEEVNESNFIEFFQSQYSKYSSLDGACHPLEPLRCMLDTGSEVNFISKELALSLAFAKVDHNTSFQAPKPFYRKDYPRDHLRDYHSEGTVGKRAEKESDHFGNDMSVIKELTEEISLRVKNEFKAHFYVPFRTKLDFVGPSCEIDTACSSSLAAIHMACNALRTSVDSPVKLGDTNDQAFSNAQDYYEHLDDNLLQRLQQEMGCEVENDGFTTSDTEDLKSPNWHAADSMTHVGDIDFADSWQALGTGNIHSLSIKASIRHTEGASGAVTLMKTIISLRHAHMSGDPMEKISIEPPQLPSSAYDQRLDKYGRAIVVPKHVSEHEDGWVLLKVACDGKISASRPPVFSMDNCSLSDETAWTRSSSSKDMGLASATTSVPSSEGPKTTDSSNPFDSFSPLAPEPGLGEAQHHRSTSFDTNMSYQMRRFLVVEDEQCDLLVGQRFFSLSQDFQTSGLGVRKLFGQSDDTTDLEVEDPADIMDWTYDPPGSATDFNIDRTKTCDFRPAISLTGETEPAI